ncbi:MAG: hypothetical protein ACOC1X_00675 [Promethearchaeota archaeon]
MEEEDKIVSKVYEVCEEQEKKSYFEVLKKIYEHICVYENEPSDNRTKSIQKIIDKETE